MSNETSDDSEEAADEDEHEELHSFINEGRREAHERAAKNIKMSKYRSTILVSPTFFICEQANSQAKFTTNNLKKHVYRSIFT